MGSLPDGNIGSWFGHQTGQVQNAEQEAVKRIQAAIDREDRSSWEIADGYVELSKMGWSQRKIAEKFSVSQTAVWKYIRCAKRDSVASQRPRFWKTYQEFDGHKETEQEKAETLPSTEPHNPKTKRPATVQRPSSETVEATHESGPDPELEADRKDDVSAPETDEDPVAKTMSWAEGRLAAVIETLRKTRVVRKDEAQEVLSCVQDALGRIRKLSEVQPRPPFKKACRKCGQEVLLAVTHNNKWMVLNSEQEFGGNFEIIHFQAVAIERDSKTKAYKSHFGSCYKQSPEPVFAEE